MSGSQHNPNIREKRLVRFLLSVLLGKPTLVRHFVEQCPDFVIAPTRWRARREDGRVTDDGALDPELMEREVAHYDATIARGKGLFNDDQLRRIAQLRNWRGDRLRTCDVPADRRSEGGAVDRDPDDGDGAQEPRRDPDRPAVAGAAARRRADRGPVRGRRGRRASAAAGMHGKRSLEGTFLGGCVFRASTGGGGDRGRGSCRWRLLLAWGVTHSEPVRCDYVTVGYDGRPAGDSATRRRGLLQCSCSRRGWACAR